ncbi:ATP-binding cassette domain-containing protein [Candidatus Bathyarchaeota archaeon]|nr:ATP-binding cassette domain-containing protein [Candidatus Bathyarchaeota archaeon]
MAYIETQDLTKKYGEKYALKNVNIKVNRGEFLALAGPSGSGKTTLLKLLDFLEEPTSGEIIFDGVNALCSEKEKLSLRRRIGMVFQQSVMFNTTVYNNVAYPLQVRGIKNNVNEKVKEALELVGLKGFEKRKALTLSGGEMQRVSLAQALVFEPELLLLDEPTANLDPRNTSIIEEIISKVNREHKVTVIMATHNLSQAERLAFKIAILYEGKIVEVKDAKEAFIKPSDFLASFANLWNVYSGEATSLEEGISLIDLGEGVKIEALTQKKGAVTVFIKPDEIIVSTVPIQSSARNVLKGKIAEIIDLNNQVQIKVNAGKEITAILTKKSFKDMKLNLDSQVYLSFKASSIRVI